MSKDTGAQVGLDSTDSALFEDFLREVQVLDDFRREYAQRYEFEGLGRDDQDVQRLIEALAFYCARTRGAAERSLARYKLRAIEQLFPHLLSPMPAMALVHPVLATNMTEVRSLPAGAELSVSGSKPQPGAHPQSSEKGRVFRVLDDIELFPLHVVRRSVFVERRAPLSGQSSERERTGCRLLLTIAPSPRGDTSRRFYDDVSQPLRRLTLHLNPAGDLLLAVRLFDALRRSLRQATARFMSDGQERVKLVTRDVHFGTSASRHKAGWDNPIEHSRRLIHFPAMLLRFGIPLVGAPSEWDRLELELELDETWPPSLAITDETFLLNAGVVENMARSMAEPLVIDGTRTRYPIDSQEPGGDWRVREILGVYRADPRTPGQWIALTPSAVRAGGYTTDMLGRGPEREAWLELEEALPGAQPITVHVEADWYDVNPVLPNPRSATVSLETHDLGPMVWRLADPLRGPCDSPLLGDFAALDQMLDLHDKRVDTPAALRVLLRVLGVEESELYGRVPRYIVAVERQVVPNPVGPAGAMTAYEVTIRGLPLVLVPAARLLFERLPEVLAVWSGESELQVSVEFEGLDEPALVRGWRASHDG